MQSSRDWTHEWSLQSQGNNYVNHCLVVEILILMICTILVKTFGTLLLYFNLGHNIFSLQMHNIQLLFFLQING